MIDVVKWSALVLLVSQTVFDTNSYGYPLKILPKVTSRSSRSSPQTFCEPKTRLSQPSGIITSSPRGTLPKNSDTSCSWSIHVSRGHQVKLEFLQFDVKDNCPGICGCNYLVVKEPIRQRRLRSRKYCNERKPPRVFVSTGKRVKIHLHLKAGNTFKGFSISYSTVSDTGSITSPAKKTTDKSLDLGTRNEASHLRTPLTGEASHSKEQNLRASSLRVRKVLPTTDYANTVATPAPTPVPTEKDKETGPSKLTVLLAVAIPVVMIFILVVLIIAYYNHITEKRQQQGRDDLPHGGSNLSDLILNSSAALVPMFNLRKAKRESSERREKANQLYDDMLQSWRQTHANRKERLRAKQESVNVWESYQASRKQKRSTRESSEDSKAFAMLVSNAINVSTTPSAQEPEDPVEEEPVFEERPRPSSILINRNSSDEIPHKRSSKVLSWSDLSTKSKEENVSEKKATSEIELKPRGSSVSGHIPAIVVSQPSLETEDDESEANDTDRLLKDDQDGSQETDPAKTQSTGNKPTYSCSEHVKDILRESYGEELEEWWQKPKKSESQASLKDSASKDSDIKYAKMETEEDDID